MSLKPSTSDSESIMSEYTKITLLEDWNSRDVENFPKFWTMSDNTEGVFFLYVGDTSCYITRSIFVKKDMSVEVSLKYILVYITNS